jgi:hypothetical protein
VPVGYAVDVLDELAASIIKTKMSSERERVPVTQSFDLHARGMEEETGALSGQVGIVDMEL